MLRYYTSFFLVASGLCHLLCCGIPIILSISSIFSNLIIFEAFYLNIELLEIGEKYLFTITTIIFLSLIAYEIYNKIKFSKGGSNCAEQECDSTKKRTKLNIYVSVVLYFFNSLIFLSENIA